MSSGKKRPRKTTLAEKPDNTKQNNSSNTPKDEDFGNWAIAYQCRRTSNTNGEDETTTTATAIHAAIHTATLTCRQDSQVVLQGRGKLRSVSSVMVLVNGYRLSLTGCTNWCEEEKINDDDGPKLQSSRKRNIREEPTDATNSDRAAASRSPTTPIDEPTTTATSIANKNIGCSRWLDFDSPLWSSWVTVELTAGAVLEIQSESPQYHSDTTATTTSTQQPLFRIYSANDPYARPTVIPPSWKCAVQAIQDDFINNHHYYGVDDDHHSVAPHCAARLFHTSENRFPREEEVDPVGTGSSSGNEKKCFQVVFAGAKGVGKSTALRYCFNQLLSSCSDSGEYIVPAVAVLDADVGQPELGPPGLLSLSIRTSPLLQQPHTHFLVPEVPQYVRAYFFGSTTSETDPQRYMECIRGLLRAFYENVDGTRVPLLVNLDGWVKGLGMEVLQALIQETLQPTHCVQILGDLKSRVFDLKVQEERTMLHTCYAFNSIQEKNGSGTPPSVDNPSLLPVPAHSMSLPPASLRSLRLLAYFLEQNDHNDDSIVTIWNRVGFGRNQQEGFLNDLACELAHRLAAAPPYVVPMETVDCIFSNAELHKDIRSEELIWNAFNGSIVGLLCKQQHSDDDAANILDPAMLPCVGLGIVRSIDRVRRLFYILTPVAHDDLVSVNALSLASNTLVLPLESTFRGVHAESTPYLEFDDYKKLDLLGAEPIKSRNTIARKSFSNNG
jgi:polynucleotide 5'-hydroxyl-kinase GRC3/NOL9